MKANVSLDDSWLIVPALQRNSHPPFTASQHWPALLLLFVSVIGIIGNLLVCLAIGTERRLHNPTNWYIFSLAIADMLISGLVIPLATVKEFTKLWILGPVLCDLWIFLDVCSCTSSIMHIVVISIDRYLAIEDPFNVRSRQKKYQICFFIIIIWLIAIFLSSPIFVLGAMNPHNILINGHCLINNSFFVIYGSVVSFAIPLLIVIVMYILTVRRLKKQIKQCQTHFAQEQIAATINLAAKPFLRRKTARHRLLSHSSPSLTIPPVELKRKRVVQQQETSFDLTDGSLMNICAEKSQYQLERQKTVSSFMHNEYTCPKNPFCELKCTCRQQAPPASLLLRSCASPKPRPISLPISILPQQTSNPSLTSLKRFRSRLLLMPGLVSTRTKSSAVRNEQKAVKVLGVVFVIFVVAWFPFCIMNILRAVCKRCSINENLLNSFVWLGYVSASINPIVYTTFNRNFRSKFLALLKCECFFSRNRSKQLSYYQGQPSLQTSRVYRPHDLASHDVRRSNARKQTNEMILT